ncbi:hypothetical protein QCI42_29890 [Bacillus fungorum]|uniref:hypothetical protein n=1 Tax=Bacillus fungorum TaxID=2039284 RepID=UPI00339A4C6C
MNIEKQYIEHTIKKMDERVEYLTKSIDSSKDKLAESDEGSYAQGLYQGQIIALENELSEVKLHIQFLQGALEN